MREIKFRGKAIMTPTELDYLEIHHNKGWVSGNLIANSGNPYIVGDVEEATDEYLNHEFWVQVVPESVGQYTGLKDKNQNPIYVGDIIDYEGLHKQNGVSRTLLVAKWNDQDACFTFGGIRTDYAIRYGEVIGNIYENPELLEVTK